MWTKNTHEIQGFAYDQPQEYQGQRSHPQQQEQQQQTDEPMESAAIPIATGTAIPSYNGMVEPQRVIFDEDVSPIIATETLPLTGRASSGGSDYDYGQVYGDGSSTSSVASTEPQYRDVAFAVAFLIQIGIIVALKYNLADSGMDSIKFNVDFIEDEMRKSDDVTEEELREMELFAQFLSDYFKIYPGRIIQFLVLPCAALASVFAFIVTAYVIQPCPKIMVQLCLVASLIGTIVISLVVVVANYDTVIVWVMAAFAIGTVHYYVKIAWEMIPYAAVNLRGALDAVSSNSSIYCVAFFCSQLGFLWTLYWFYVTVGTFAYMGQKCYEEHPDVDAFSDNDICSPPMSIVVLALTSLYWTSTVFVNTMQVTVAGTTATWCFDKTDASGCCSPAVYNSLYRSLTYSLGSICLGSLLQGVVSMLRYMIESTRRMKEAERRNNECSCVGSILLCFVECIAKWLEEIVDYFNQWAYVFVGIYGYSYLESGKRVIELFRARGWSSLLTNGLVSFFLSTVKIFVGLMTGFAAIAVDYFASKKLAANNADILTWGDGPDAIVGSYVVGPFAAHRFVVFTLGFIVGCWIASLMMSVVQGAVNTLIVCWADAPTIMEMNHPELTTEMEGSWGLMFPEATVASTNTNVDGSNSSRAVASPQGSSTTTYNAVVL